MYIEHSIKMHIPRIGKYLRTLTLKIVKDFIYKNLVSILFLVRTNCTLS